MIKELEERLELKVSHNPDVLNNNIKQIKKLISDNVRFRELINEKTSFCDLTFYELTWKYIKLKNNLKDIVTDNLYNDSIESLERTS